MIEIRFHGRGGQGIVTAANILAEAAFLDGKFSQAFPFYGTERTGAPISAFCRIDDKFIKLREHVYNPDYVVVLDQTLVNTINIKEGIKKNTIIVINTNEVKKEKNVIKTNLSKLSLEIIGKPFVNTASLGVLSCLDLVSIKSLETSIKNNFPEKIANLNIRAMRTIFKNLGELNK